MSTPPETIGGAKLVCYTPIDERHRFTGVCRQVVAGQLMCAMAGLAICRLPTEGAFYLFGCDAEWGVVTDGWHQSLEDAMLQAEFEYEGVTRTWTHVA